MLSKAYSSIRLNELTSSCKVDSQLFSEAVNIAARKPYL